MAKIDLTAQLDDIRARYPQWWKSDDATRELQTLWGNPDCNDCGVFTEQERISFALPGHAQWKGIVKLAVAPNGWHAFATSYSYPLGGGGYAISVWNRTAFTTRDDALHAGISELIGKFEGVRDANGYKPASQAADASRMIEELRGYLAQARQLALF
jgi:hypothetical protein